MIKIGITGQNGFIGYHLYNELGHFPDEFERIDFKRSFFSNQEELQQFVSKCDVIVHLAAINRHEDTEYIYHTNVELVGSLIDALTITQSKAHVIFSSSSQENRDNTYGKSKRQGREMFQAWANATGGTFTGLLIPNVFGPFGQPDYNSFIATFCSKLAQNEAPIVDNDSNVQLIYVHDLVKEIIEGIRSGIGNDKWIVGHTDEYLVSEILDLLKIYKLDYQTKGIIPVMNNVFQVNLFNTFRSYLNLNELFPVNLNINADPRGTFVEIIKLNVGGQISFSTTVPGITRGNHYHTRKIERFAVINGNALIKLRKVGTEQVLEFFLSGEQPAYVDMPIWYTHNITNIGEDVLYTVFWINEFFDEQDTDTYFENV